MPYAHKYGIHCIKVSLSSLYQLGLGGTAVRTGLNTIKGYATDIANKIASTTGLPFTSAGVAGMFSTLACTLNKIANDVQLLGSSPRCGLGELSLPENESCPAKFQHNVRH